MYKKCKLFFYSRKRADACADIHPEFPIILGIIVAFILARLFAEYFHYSAIELFNSAGVHHFYVGVILLIVTSLIHAFRKCNKSWSYLILFVMGNGIGLITDEFIYAFSATPKTLEYYKDVNLFFTALLTTLFFILLTMLLYSWYSKRHN